MVASSRRSDAERNRARILAAARSTFGADRSSATREQSMAEVARRAGVGRATLYRNFPDRRELLEALYVEEVDAVCTAAGQAQATSSGEALLTWLRRFASFLGSKHLIAAELLEHTEATDEVFGGSRRRVLAAAQPLLAAAQAAGEVRPDVTVEQATDLVLAVARLDRAPDQVAQVLRVALDGLLVVPDAELEV